METTVSAVMGAPPVTWATKREAQLTEAVRRRPYPSAALTRSEKAHPDVFNNSFWRSSRTDG